MINVTQTFLPDQSEYQEILKSAWDNKWLTNRGQLVKELEVKLTNFLNVKNLTLTTNGTLPLQIAIKALGLKGEVITTPFSYVATTSSIVWENCTPVFVDIDEEYLTIDEDKIEAAISSKTSAILATHVFGNPCKTEVIKDIADKYNLKVIYDAAHCFGVKYKGQSVFNYGDISTCSFHATKIFHTGEGGCWITSDDDLHKKMFFNHNFGHDGPTDFNGVGINAKMSELQAAMGLSVFNHLEEIFEARKNVVDFYRSLLKDKPLQMIKLRDNTEWNFHYFPVVFESEAQLLRVLKILNEKNIFPRRYFYPSLNTLTYLKYEYMPISEKIASTILCLPNFVGLTEKEIIKITDLIKKVL